ncbi:ribonuclease J [Williamsia herbipolensis]|uniref:ribonuclease J n=1 Tax=Williamsia herbipolensis TaxID=1603258 RepID=UPI0005F85FE4|nr:ribonuclease J [Williamsia herbipolensis]
MTGPEQANGEPTAPKRRRRAATRRSGPPEPAAPTPPAHEQPTAAAAPVKTNAAPAQEKSAPTQKKASGPAVKDSAGKDSARSAESSGGGRRRGKNSRGNGGGGGSSEPRRDRSPQVASQPVGDVTDRLGLPKKLPRNGLRVVALGGIGEIGRNMTVFEFDGKLLIVDCGVQFPDKEPGISLMIPNFSPIAKRINQIEAILLTHGHEDHIGAIPYLLRLRSDIPIFGSVFTLAILKAKCAEHRISPNLIPVENGTRTQHGAFSSEFISVTHSIPHSFSIGITCGETRIFHSGDLKIDPTPIDGRITDLNRMALFAQAGLDLALVDSTNADIPGFVASEQDVAATLDRIIGAATARIFLASFASNIHRVQSVIDAAERHGRKICFLGRSMVRNTQIALDEGYLNKRSVDLIDVDELLRLPANRTIIVCTGSQGEPMAALSRISRGQHRQMKIEPGDTAIFSSSVVPGNEKSVTGVLNDLTRRGAKVITSAQDKVHVTGHAPAGELLYLYNILKPRNVLPIHGEWKHLVANHHIAVSAGVDEARVLIAEDGVVVDLEDGIASFSGRHKLENVYLDGGRLDDITSRVLDERDRLTVSGAVVVAFYYDSGNKLINGAVRVESRGLTSSESLDIELARFVSKEIDGLLSSYSTAEILQRRVESISRRWVKAKYGREPVIIAVLMDLHASSDAVCS